jgi:hypothetical protein
MVSQSADVVNTAPARSSRRANLRCRARPAGAVHVVVSVFGPRSAGRFEGRGVRSAPSSGAAENHEDDGMRGVVAGDIGADLGDTGDG